MSVTENSSSGSLRDRNPNPSPEIPRQRTWVGLGLKYRFGAICSHDCLLARFETFFYIFKLEFIYQYHISIHPSNASSKKS